MTNLRLAKQARGVPQRSLSNVFANHAEMGSFGPLLDQIYLAA
jgi:hypothetical protein